MSFDVICRYVGLCGRIWCYMELCGFMRRYVALYGFFGVTWRSVALCCAMLRHFALWDVM